MLHKINSKPVEAILCMKSYFVGVYGGATALPTVLADKCDGSTCSTLTTDVTAVKSCLTDPTAADCTGCYNRLCIMNVLADGIREWNMYVIYVTVI